jgi:hypothetical protein
VFLVASVGLRRVDAGKEEGAYGLYALCSACTAFHGCLQTIYSASSRPETTNSGLPKLPLAGKIELKPAIAPKI